MRRVAVWCGCGGEQPIEIAYTNLALDKPNDLIDDCSYRKKVETAAKRFFGQQ